MQPRFYCLFLRTYQEGSLVWKLDNLSPELMSFVHVLIFALSVVLEISFMHIYASLVAQSQNKGRYPLSRFYNCRVIVEDSKLF